MDCDSYIITVDNLAFGGSGVGRRPDGKVVFVPQSVPGEKLRVSSVKEHGSYCEARLLDILEPSPHRQKPRCAAFLQCGGCDWQHIAYEQQIVWKEHILLREIEKVFAKDSFEMLPTLAAESQYHYRCHTVMKCSLRSNVLLGYHQRKSHKIVEMDSCPVRVERLNQTIATLRAEFVNYPIPALQEMDLYAPDDEVYFLARLHAPLKKSDVKKLKDIAGKANLAGLLAMDNRRNNSELLSGSENFCYRVHADDQVISLSGGVGGFIQGNMRMNSLMVSAVLDLVRGSGQVLDLFSGCGNFSVPMAHAANKVVAVERDRRLAAMTTKNAIENNRQNLVSLCMDVTKQLDWCRKQAFDTIVIDPPREGAKTIMPALASMQPEKIIYVSCNPTTLGRDLALLKPHGYHLRKLRLVDMFPQTYHIESIVLLERGSP